MLCTCANSGLSGHTWRLREPKGAGVCVCTHVLMHTCVVLYTWKIKAPHGKKFRIQIFEVYSGLVLGYFIIIIIYYFWEKMSKFLVQQGMSSGCCLLVLFFWMTSARPLRGEGVDQHLFLISYFVLGLGCKGWFSVFWHKAHGKWYGINI